MTARLPAPFPYVGGKSRIAGEVWRELGDPYSFLDPFMGSNAMLLARPGLSPGPGSPPARALPRPGLSPGVKSWAI